jgi:hypothetical protein
MQFLYIFPYERLDFYFMSTYTFFESNNAVAVLRILPQKFHGERCGSP